jgi:multiple antibiotic resistance protein
VAVSVTILLAFLAAEPISRLLGKVGMMIVVRVLGLILAALAVQFILVGFSDATAGIIKRSAANPYPAAIVSTPAKGPIAP